eukprot:gene6546-biopygen13729
MMRNTGHEEYSDKEEDEYDKEKARGDSHGLYGRIPELQNTELGAIWQASSPSLNAPSLSGLPESTKLGRTFFWMSIFDVRRWKWILYYRARSISNVSHRK